MAGNTLAVDIVAKTDGLTAGLARATGQLDAFNASVNKASATQTAVSGEQSLQSQAMTTAQVWVASRRAMIDAETHANTVLRAGRKADVASLGDALATMEQRRDAFLAASRAYYESMTGAQQTAFAAQEAAANKEIEAEYQRLAARLDDATAIQTETAALDENTAATVVNGSTAREATYMIDEIASGRFRRLGGSSVVLANRLGLMQKLFTPLGLAISGTAVAAGVLTAAFIEGERQSDAFDRAVLSTNDAMGVTQGRFESMADAIAGGDITIGTARSALLTLAQSGRFTGTTLQEAGQAAVDFADLTGSSMKQAASDVEQLAQRPLEAVVKLNNQYHFLTASEYQHIAALQAEGNATGAARAAIDAFGAAMHRRAEQSMRDEGDIVKGWEDIKQGIMGAWDALESFGRTDTVQSQIAGIQNQLAALKQRDPYDASGAQATLEARLRTLQAQERQNAAAAEAKAKQDQINAAGVRAASELDKQVAGLRSVNVALEHEKQITAEIEALHKASPHDALLKGDQFNAQGHLTKGNSTYDALISNIQRKFDSHPVQIRLGSPSAGRESTSGIESMLEADRSALAQMTGIDQAQASTASAIDQMRVQAAVRALNAEVSAGVMSAGQRQAVEERLTQTLYAEDIKRLQTELGTLTQGTVAYQQMYDRIVTMKEQEVIKLDALTNQTVGATRRAATDQASAWSAMTSTIMRSEGNLVQNIISGRRTLNQSLLAIGQEMVAQEIQNDMRLLTSKLLIGKAGAAQQQQLEQQSLMYQLAADAQKLMSTITTEGAKTAAEVAGSQTRVAAKAAARAEGKAAEIASNQGEIMSAAATAAAKSYQALAGIPIIGPALGAVAAVATFTAVEAYKNMASFDQGTISVPHDGMAMIHRGEMVLPPPQASVMRDALGSGGGNAGSGGDVHLHIHTPDADGARRFLLDNQDAVAEAVRGAHRSGAFNA
jgi:hypothetical protein